jgi:hypothetical protein
LIVSCRKVYWTYSGGGGGSLRINNSNVGIGIADDRTKTFSTIHNSMEARRD